VKFDQALPMVLADLATDARALEAAGFDGLWANETRHDPFLAAREAAAVTERVTIGTQVAIAFARSPMTMAATAFDLAAYTHGRFVLGVGSQVKAHVVRRFSMPWSHPAPRMREFVGALRAIWTAWQDGTQLDFRGHFYSHTLMNPFFAPPAHEWGAPPVYVAGVGPEMTAVAGELADGFLAHPFTTGRYLREVTLPALARGRARSGRTTDAFAVCVPAWAVTGSNDEQLERAIAATRERIAFYASTPSYRAVLELHGRGHLQDELGEMSRQGRWSAMASLIDDELLHEVAVVGDVDTVVAELHRRFDGVVHRLTFYLPQPDGAREAAGQLLAAARIHGRARADP
jgi:probable F420-dependent oxidoreductase